MKLPDRFSIYVCVLCSICQLAFRGVQSFQFAIQWSLKIADPHFHDIKSPAVNILHWKSIKFTFDKTKQHKKPKEYTQNTWMHTRAHTPSPILLFCANAYLCVWWYDGYALHIDQHNQCYMPWIIHVATANSTHEQIVRFCWQMALNVVQC